MVDNINLLKILIPASSPRKIKALDQKQSNMQDRQFKKHLEKKNDENKDSNTEEWHKNNKNETYEQKQKRSAGKNGEHQGLVMTRKKNEWGADKLIDIVV